MSKRILIVEDDPKSLYALRSILQDRGFDVVGSANAEEAIYSKEDHFDAALLDVRLPGQSGTQLATVLRARKPTIQLIFMTAYNGVEDIRTRFPNSHILVKPLDLDTILRLLKENIV